MEPQNNGFFHRLTHKTMVVSVDENGNPTKVIEKNVHLFWYGLVYMHLFLVYVLYFYQ